MNDSVIDFYFTIYTSLYFNLSIITTYYFYNWKKNFIKRNLKNEKEEKIHQGQKVKDHVKKCQDSMLETVGIHW